MSGVNLLGLFKEKLRITEIALNKWELRVFE